MGFVTWGICCSKHCRVSNGLGAPLAVRALRDFGRLLVRGKEESERLRTSGIIEILSYADVSAESMEPQRAREGRVCVCVCVSESEYLKNWLLT